MTDTLSSHERLQSPCAETNEVLAVQYAYTQTQPDLNNFRPMRF